MAQERFVRRKAWATAVFLAITLTMTAGLETPAANATPAPIENWYPAGPAENTLAISIFPGRVAEGNALATGSLDLMDTPLTPPQRAALCPLALFSCAISASGVFAYSSSWNRVINSPTVGVPNFFTWLNAYKLNQPVCSPIQTCPPFPVVTPIRQGFAQSTTSLNPYQAPRQVRQNFYVLDNVYDRLYRANPMNPGQIMDWMTSNSRILDLTGLTYSPPGGTVAVLRNTLRSGINFHDGFALSAWDVAFSYLSLMATSAPQIPPELLCPAGPSCLVTGITVLGPNQFDLDLNTPTLSSSQRQNIGSLTILPGHLWSTLPATDWQNSCIATTTPAVFSIPTNQPCMTVSPGLPAADPLIAGNPVTSGQGILTGSGPWYCGPYPPLQVGSGCTFSPKLQAQNAQCMPGNADPACQTQNPGPGGTITLRRFGCVQMVNQCGPPGYPQIPALYYFRSSGNLALYFWTGNTGDLLQDFLNFGVVTDCVPQALNAPGCTRWQEGIGNPNPNGALVGLSQVGLVQSYLGVRWTEPFAWAALTGIGSSPPVPYEGATVLNLNPPNLLFQLSPDTSAGCLLAGNGGGAISGYPNGGGYNC